MVFKVKGAVASFLVISAQLGGANYDVLEGLKMVSAFTE